MVDQHEVSLSIRQFQDLLQSHASTMPGRTLLDDVLKHLWQMSSVDSLFGLFDGLGDLFDPPKSQISDEDDHRRIQLSPTSPLGSFVRRARLEFARLPFDDIVHLWCTFITYRAPTALWKNRVAGTTLSSVDQVATEMELGQDDDLFQITYGRLVEGVNVPVLPSVDDLERVLEFQLDKLQRGNQCLVV